MESTPVSRASLETRCGGIRLQSCPSTLSLDAVGLVFLFFTSAEWQSQRAMPTTFFCALAKSPMGCLWDNSALDFRACHEINISNISGIRMNCIVPFSVE
jgi:hypothetical protein